MNRQGLVFPVIDCIAFVPWLPANLTLQEDWLKGELVFRLRSGSVTAGEYKFIVDATVEGGQLTGFWRGTPDGQPILTTSSKLSGALTVP